MGNNRYEIKLLPKTGLGLDRIRVIFDNETKKVSPTTFPVKRMALKYCAALNDGEEKNKANWFGFE